MLPLFVRHKALDVVTETAWCRRVWVSRAELGSLCEPDGEIGFALIVFREVLRQVFSETVELEFAQFVEKVSDLELKP